jgi:hypothetical protein
LGANSSKREFIRGKWEQIPHTGIYTTACAPRYALVLLLFCSRFAPRPDGISSGMHANAMKPPKMDPTVVIVHSTFLFWNLDFSERHILSAISRANYEQITSKSLLRRFPGVMISLEQVIGPIHTQ